MESSVWLSIVLLLSLLSLVIAQRDPFINLPPRPEGATLGKPNIGQGGKPQGTPLNNNYFSPRPNQGDPRLANPGRQGNAALKGNPAFGNQAFQGNPAFQGRQMNPALQGNAASLQGYPFQDYAIAQNRQPLPARRDPSTLLNTQPGRKVSDLCYIPAGSNSCAPHFIIAGAMKSGSTSLFTYLQKHPLVLPLREDAKLNNRPILANKEIRFFNDPLYSQMTQNIGVSQALKQYFEIFPEISETSPNITGESSPMYICQHRVAERIKAALPQSKIVILLRDPVDRTYSEHWFKFQLQVGDVKDATMESRLYKVFEECTRREISVYKYCGIESMLTKKPTNESIAELESCYAVTNKILARISPTDTRCVEGGTYYGLCMPLSSLPEAGRSYACNDQGIRNSLYYFQLMEWVATFDKSQLMIIQSEYFYEKPEEVMAKVCEFLGIEPFDWSGVGLTAYNIVNPMIKGRLGDHVPDGDRKGLGIGQRDKDALKDKYPPMSADFRIEMQQFFSPFNNLLTRLLGRKFWDY